MGAIDIMASQSALEEQFKHDNKVLDAGAQLFLANDANFCLDQHIGRIKISDESLRAWRNLLAQRKAQMRARRIPFLTVIVPTKESVYDDFLPPEYSPKSTHRSVHQIVAVLKALGLPFLTLEDELIAARKERETFIATDVHWNEWGAYIGYTHIMRALPRAIRRRVALLDPDRVAFHNRLFVRGLGIKLTPPRRCEEVVCAIESPTATIGFFNRIARNGMRITQTNSALPHAPRLLIFGNSFGQYLLKFFAESFSRVDYIFAYDIDYALIDRLKPDMIIYQTVERYLVKCPSDKQSSLAVACAKIRQYTPEQALANARLSVANLASGEPDAYFMHALLLLRGGEVEQALRFYQIALQMRPDAPEYHRGFSEMLGAVEKIPADIRIKRL